MPPSLSRPAGPARTRPRGSLTASISSFNSLRSRCGQVAGVRLRTAHLDVVQVGGEGTLDAIVSFSHPPHPLCPSRDHTHGHRHLRSSSRKPADLHQGLATLWPTLCPVRGGSSFSAPRPRGSCRLSARSRTPLARPWSGRRLNRSPLRRAPASAAPPADFQIPEVVDVGSRRVARLVTQRCGIDEAVPPAGIGSAVDVRPPVPCHCQSVWKERPLALEVLERHRGPGLSRHPSTPSLRSPHGCLSIPQNQAHESPDLCVSVVIYPVRQSGRWWVTIHVKYLSQSHRNRKRWFGCRAG